MSTTATQQINGVNVDALHSLVEKIKADPAQGVAGFAARTDWIGGVASQTRIDHWRLGGERLERNFTINIDEPPELLGQAAAANPQEYLLAAVNACMLATFVAACSVNGVLIERLSVESEGELDLRGFLAISARVKPGYERIETRFRVKADAPQKKLEEILRFVEQTSPNFDNLATPVRMEMSLSLEA